VSKQALVQRELKRYRLSAKFSSRYVSLKEKSKDFSLPDVDRQAARLALQKIPRNANPTRLRNRCDITGRPRGTFRQFGLSRAKIREMAFVGEIPGLIKASW